MIKTHFFRLSVLLGIAFLLFSCEGPQGDPGPTGPTGLAGVKDKQLRFQISPMDSLVTSDTLHIFYRPTQGIIKFDIRNYAAVDSVVLVASIYTSDTSAICSYGLVSLKDTSFVVGSEVKTKTLVDTIAQSGNFYSKLPQQEITLVPYLKSGKAGTTVVCSQSFLMLYRKL